MDVFFINDDVHVLITKSKLDKRLMLVICSLDRDSITRVWKYCAQFFSNIWRLGRYTPDDVAGPHMIEREDCWKYSWLIPKKNKHHIDIMKTPIPNVDNLIIFIGNNERTVSEIKKILSYVKVMYLNEVPV